MQKDLQPHPMYLSQGIEGKYTFIVQDKAGVRHRQMVTPEVFERYAVGQYFNDQEMGPSGPAGDGKLMRDDAMTASRSSAPKNPVQLAKKSSAAQSVKVARAKIAAKAKRRLAAKAAKRRAAVLAAKRKRSKPVKSAVTVAYLAPAVQSVAAVSSRATTADLGVVTVARCR